MASSSSSSSSLSILVISLSLLSLLQPSFSATCKSTTLPTFDNCNDLPTLDAILHWTYDPTQSSLSIAFTAPAPTPNGWVAWALNPTSTGMVGAQALIAFKPTTTSPVTASTYDIKSYRDITKGPISINVTAISAKEDASNGEITIFATWGLPIGLREVNQVWQVGPVVNGRVGKHEFKPDNLGSTMTLDLGGGGGGGSSGSGLSLAPVGAPASGPAQGEMGGSTAPAPVKGGAVKTSFGMASVAVVLGALVASLF